jgi:cytochrome P450
MRKSITELMAGKLETTVTPTIFHELLKSSLPAEEKTLDRLIDEAQAVVAAGQVTTTHFLTTLSYHLLANPFILQKLKSELDSISSSNLPSLQALENLPYLNAVLNESFRVSYGPTHRLQRISPDFDLQFQSWTIPKGTPVGMTSIFMHTDPFPEPHIFNPERWLKDDSKKLERYLVNFSRGSRACLGMNLARAEIYLVVAAVFGGYDMELFDTTREDVDVAADYFDPQPKTSRGVRVVVK